MFGKTKAVVSTTKTGKHLMGICGAAMDASGLSIDAMVRVTTRGDELKVRLINLLKEISATFDPATFIGPGWKIDPSDAQLLTPSTAGKFDPAKVVFRNMHRSGETCLDGEKRIERHREAGSVVLGAEEFLWCWNNRDKLESWKRTDNGGMRHVVLFDGTILRGPSCKRYVLCLYWLDGAWRWDCHWLDNDWEAQHMSAVLLVSVPART